ncbi:MAG: C69 family dipeptidase, partial [Muribaculaceae bacterium]|nr:C69 family dipeptidase [Muribaculaceae bacterium]
CISYRAHTYGTIGNMNEYGVAISESTWGGRPELKGPNGILDYGSLMFIALQRAKTAREAIKIMTDLVEEYGYYSTGESFSIADENEAWIMEMIGKGKDEKGAVWVAMRVPDDCISGHANHSRIHQFPLNDPENCLYSPDVISFARKKGWFDGKDEDFSFSLAYAQYKYSSLRGCDGRVWAFYNKFADGMDKYLPWVTEGDGQPLPLWIKPNRKLTATDLKWMMRDHFEGTPFDMTEDIGAGPFKMPYRWRPSTFEVDGKTYYQERAIATQQTGYSFVAEINGNRPDAIKGLMWFGTDDANTCVYLPIFCTVERPPFELAKDNGDLYNISWDSNFWVNNYVANQAYSRYNQMIPDIRKVQSSLEDSIAVDVRVAIEQLPTFDTDDQRLLVQDLADIWANKATKQYKKLGDYLLVKYLDGNIKIEDENGFVSTEDKKPVAPKFGGYDEKYYRSIVEDSGDRLKVHELKVKQKH